MPIPCKFTTLDLKRFRLGIAVTAIATMITLGTTLSQVVEANGMSGSTVTNGEMTADTDDTIAPTTSKPPPTALKINTISGILWEDPNNLPVSGPTFTLTNVVIETLTASGADLFDSSLNIQYTGVPTGDTNIVSFAPLETPVILERSCVQPQTDTAIGCASALATSSRPTDVPEPTSLVVLSSALLGFGLLRYRAQADQGGFGKAVNAR